MKKEVFFAVFLGFVLGLIITFGIWTANKSLKQANIAVANPQPTSVVSPTSVSASPTPASQITISISSPVDESVTSKATASIEGKTAPNAVVAIYYDLGEQFVTANASGNFVASVPLDSGYNFITATAYDDKGNSASQDLTLTYTTQKI